MSAARPAAWLAGCLLLISAGAAHGQVVGSSSPLALRLGTWEPSGAALGLLAQRSIERQWGPAEEDSEYVEIDVPDWRSPGLALSLSGIFPGAGQIYAGERVGWAYAALEAATWVGYLFYHHRGEERRDDAARFAGSPTDTTSLWSFARYQRITGQSVAELEALYAKDPNVFYDLIAHDDRYIYGWGGVYPTDSRLIFDDMRSDAEKDLKRARWTSEFIWLHHLASAVDALRAARIHNLPLEHNLEIQLRGAWRSHGPEVAVLLERKF